MTLTLVLHSEAADELRAAVAWYDQGGQNRGQSFMAAYKNTIGRCLMWPESGAATPIAGQTITIRSAKVPRSSYQVIYFVNQDTLHVIAVAHERRRPGYWASRLASVS